MAVRRLRVRGPAEAAGAARLLAGVSVRPSGLEAGATLVVRRLHDPRPRLLDPARGSAAPPDAWQRALERSLEEELRGAARPALGPVPAAATAVLFANRAELLACLAAGWCDGTAWLHWWWRGLLRASDPAQAVLALWRESPAEAPAALELLAGRGLAATYVSRLPAGEARALAAAIAAVHGLGTVRPGPAAAERRPDPPPRADTAAGEPRPEPPWRELVPEARVPLAKEQELLLGIALLLRRRPALLRGPEPRRRLRRWLAAAPVPARGRHPVAAVQPLPVPAAARAVEHPQMDPPRRHAPPTPRARQGRTRARERMAPPPLRRSAPKRGDAPREPAPLAPPAAGLEAAASTRLGGLFYLVPYGQHVGLYADFGSPLRTGIALDLWDFVTLLGRRLLGRPPADPVWALLARLAGREPGVPPGRGFRAPPSWRVPREWVEPFETPGPWRWTAGDGRLRVRHPAGFDVVDVAGDEHRLARELRRYGSPPVRRASRTHGAPAGDPWLHRLTEYSRLRLGLALGVPPPRAAGLLLRQPARVLVTATRVDVHVAIEEVKVEVRAAGLDRDPGWVPAAGRTLAFHFG